MTCKDCIHEKVCKHKDRPIPLCDCTYGESDNVEKIGCPFADKSRFIEVQSFVPYYKDGDTVWYYSSLDYDEKSEALVPNIKETKISGIGYAVKPYYECEDGKMFFPEHINVAVFSTRQEVKKALRRLRNEY